ncbi:anti-sigma-K factor RskA [Prauserella shujinwangii]|uniref:Regulator of SigK n=1 Tax=Prauserella shujinwangii TaxID=1453103 RepID=A0A2T0LS51_9PSEU|nr:anti-sigma factor [Prauserella shujinwangii]PRX46488.1 anti-sigma-K factor RskA [Prauserella shujinwangii]
MTSPDMHTLAGAFALNALDEHERARFRRHLAECPSCSQEVRELQATAARLGAASAEDPPPDLRRRVLAQVHETRQQSPASGPDPRERSRRGAGMPRWVLGLAAAAAVVGLALAGVFGGIALDTQGRLEAAQERIDQAREKYAPIADLLAAADVRTVHVETSIGGQATVVFSRSRNTAMVMGSELPPQDAGRAYELWMLDDEGDPVSAGVLPPPDQPGSLVLARGIDDAEGMAITVEQAGGSPSGQPTTPPIMKVDMPA